MKIYRIIINILYVAAILAFILAPMLANADEVTLAWDYGTDEILGFTFYFNGPESYTKTILDPAAREMSFDGSGMAVGTYDIYMTAFTDRIESSPSNTIQLTVQGYTPPADTLPAAVTITVPIIQ